MAIDHDGLFKKLLRTFFREFILLFYPDLDAMIDYEHVKFLSEEVYTDITGGKKGRVDLLVEVRLKDEAALIIIHIEPQSYVEAQFPERMFLYASRLYEKYRRRIVPIALFSHGAARDEPDSFGWGFPFLQVMTFRYYTIELHKKNWREYIQSNNPVAAALLSKMGYNKSERVRVKIEFLRMLVGLQLDPARTELLAAFFETYLKLNPQEEILLHHEIEQMPKEVRVMELMTSWEKKGRKEGKIEVARNLLAMGVDLKLIKRATGLREADITQLGQGEPLTADSTAHESLNQEE